MNKALHAFVYLFLVLAGAALWFELQLNAKRTLLTERNRLQEDAFVKIAKTIEKAEPSKDVVVEIRKDTAPVEARLIDTPDTENVLGDDYKAYLEQQNLETFNWDGKRSDLREVYALDADGNPIMDGGRPMPGKEGPLLDSLLAAAIKQQSNLNSTRAELTKLRGILADTVEELNDLKPMARQDKVTIAEKDDKIAELERAKSAAEAETVKIKGQIDDLNGEIASLRDEVQTAKDEAAQAAEKLEEAEKKAANLAKALQDAYQSAGSASAGSASAGIAAVSFGEKGKVVSADNEYMFATIALSDTALKELKGEKLDKPIVPGIEFTIKREGYNGEAGDIIGRIRTRQEIPGKNYVICDILSAWRQADVRADDVVFSD